MFLEIRQWVRLNNRRSIAPCSACNSPAAPYAAAGSDGTGHTLRYACLQAHPLHPGDAVPSERELARVYEASLMTARHALGRWSGKGWWTGEGARRNVRSAAQDPLQPLGQLHRAMASRGLPARSRILCAGVVKGSRKGAARLALPANSRLVKVERLRQSGEQPFALESCNLLADEFAGLASLPVDGRSLFATLERE